VYYRKGLPNFVFSQVNGQQISSILFQTENYAAQINKHIFAFLMFRGFGQTEFNC